MSEYSEAVADIIETLAEAGAGGTITVRRVRDGALDAATGRRDDLEQQVTLTALKGSPEELSVSVGAFDVEAGRIAYAVATADLTFEPEPNDQIEDGTDCFTIGQVRGAMGGHAKVLVVMDQGVM